jgi:hypothetical protein
MQYRNEQNAPPQSIASRDHPVFFLSDLAHLAGLTKRTNIPIRLQARASCEVLGAYESAPCCKLLNSIVPCADHQITVDYGSGVATRMTLSPITWLWSFGLR